MSNYICRKIAFVQENLHKSHWKSTKISKVVKPLKTIKHYKVLRKYHNHRQFKLIKSPDTCKRSIYWTSIEHKLLATKWDCHSIPVDCEKFSGFNELSSESICPLVNPQLNEFICNSPLDSICIDYLNSFSNQIYAVSQCLICYGIFNRAILNSIDFHGIRFVNLPKSERNFNKNSNFSLIVENFMKNCWKNSDKSSHQDRSDNSDEEKREKSTRKTFNSDQKSSNQNLSDNNKEKREDNSKKYYGKKSGFNVKICLIDQKSLKNRSNKKKEKKSIRKKSNFYTEFSLINENIAKNSQKSYNKIRSGSKNEEKRENSQKSQRKNSNFCIDNCVKFDRKNLYQYRSDNEKEETEENSDFKIDFCLIGGNFHQNHHGNRKEKQEETPQNISLISNKSTANNNNNKNNHQFSHSSATVAKVIPENWTKNRLVALEKTLWDSVIPRSWLFLFQFSDFYLESCMTAIITSSLLKEGHWQGQKKGKGKRKEMKEVGQKGPKGEHCLLPTTEKQKEIKGILKDTKKPKIHQSNRMLNKVVRKICRSLIYESVILGTKRKHIPRNAVKSEKKNKLIATIRQTPKARESNQPQQRKRSVNINNSDVKTKSSVVLSNVLSRGRNQIDKSLINENLNRNLRVHNRYTTVLTSNDFRFSFQPMERSGRTRGGVLCYKKKERLERIVIKVKATKNCNNNPNRKSGDFSGNRNSTMKCARFRGNYI